MRRRRPLHCRGHPSLEFRDSPNSSPSCPRPSVAASSLQAWDRRSKGYAMMLTGLNIGLVGIGRETLARCVFIFGNYSYLPKGGSASLRVADGWSSAVAGLPRASAARRPLKPTTASSVLQFHAADALGLKRSVPADGARLAHRLPHRGSCRGAGPSIADLPCLNAPETASNSPAGGFRQWRRVPRGHRPPPGGPQPNPPSSPCDTRTLSLGIPGDAVMAVLLGAADRSNGITPGPALRHSREPGHVLWTQGNLRSNSSFWIGILHC